MPSMVIEPTGDEVRREPGFEADAVEPAFAVVLLAQHGARRIDVALDEVAVEAACWLHGTFEVDTAAGFELA